MQSIFNETKHYSINNSPLQISFYSNNKTLSISITNPTENEYYYSTYTKDDLTTINKHFGNIPSLNQIFHHIIHYIQSNPTKISYTTTQQSIFFKCNDLFNQPNDNDVNFIIDRSLSYTTTFIPINEKLRQITNNYNNNDLLYYNISSFKHINVFIIHITISLIMLISIMFLLVQYTTTPHYFPGSKIASISDINTISKWINPNYIYNYTLLYRATKDGDSASTFHKLCDRKEHTLTLIHTQNGWKFGGYTDTPWVSVAHAVRYFVDYCKECFLFSLNKRKMYPFQKESGRIKNDNEGGPVFGLKDIVVSNNFLEKESTCSFPDEYGRINDLENEFNGGKSEFVVKELEIYLVIKQSLK